MTSIPEPIAVIGGTGDLGQGLCRFFLHNGIHTVVGSRKSEKADRIAGELAETVGKEIVDGYKNVEAAKRCAVAVLTIPFWGHESILPELRPHLSGKVVLDTTVPLSEDDPTRYDEPEAGSAALRVQQLLGEEVKLVASFHTLSAHTLEDPEKLPEADVFYCGDPEGKQVVSRLMERVGFNGRDAGDLDRSTTLERLTPMIIHFNRMFKKRSIGLKLTGL